MRGLQFNESEVVLQDDWAMGASAMALFSAMKASSAYEEMLEARGISPRSIPPDVHARICSYTEQQYKRTAARIPLAGGPGMLEGHMHNAAELVAFCINGPHKFAQCGGDVSNQLKELGSTAETWLEKGSEGSLNSMIIKTLDDANLLSADFLRTLQSILDKPG